MLFLLGLLFLMPAGTLSFWLVVGALALLAAMHASYWLITHRVNRFWLKDIELQGAGATFFSLGAKGVDLSRREPAWTQLRDRWEYSHVLRAGFAAASLILLVTAIAVE